jgi:hypothetical protein
MKLRQVTYFWVNNTMNVLQAFLPTCAMLYLLGVVFYLMMWSLNESLKVATKDTYSFVISVGDTRTEKEKLKSEIIYTLFYLSLKILCSIWTLIWYIMKHIFVFVMSFTITFFIFLALPSQIIPQQFLINSYTLSILTIVNTTILLQSTKENDYSPKSID